MASCHVLRHIGHICQSEKVLMNSMIFNSHFHLHDYIVIQPTSKLLKHKPLFPL